MMKFIGLFLSLNVYGLCLSAQEADTVIHEIKGVTVTDKKKGNFGHLRSLDEMKLTVGKKSEVINVAALTVNKSTNNTRQVYAKVTGLNIFENDGSGLQLSIGGRGLDPNRTANFNVRQNGYDISADALGYPESYYTPPSDALSRIELIKGAASLQFGTQFGGLLNFRMKQPGGEKKIAAELKQTIGSWGFLGSYNSVNGSIGKFSYFAYAHYKRGDGWRPNSHFESFNAYGDFHFQLNERHRIGLEITSLYYTAQQPGGLDDRMFAEDARQSNRERNWFRVKWNLLNLHWDAQLSSGIKWQTQVYALMAGRDALGYRPNRPSQPDNGGERDLLKGDFNTLGFESRLVKSYKLGAQTQHLLAGVRIYNGKSKSVQGNVNNPGDKDFTFHDPGSEVLNEYTLPNNNVALFAEQWFKLSDRWSITPGVRWEWIRTRAQGMYREVVRDLRDSIIQDNRITENRELPRSFFIAGLGLNYSYSDQLDIYGNLSQNYRSVTFSDIRTINPSFEIDKDISDERGWSADLGVRGKIKDLVRFDVSIFHLYYGNRIGEYYYARPNGQVVRKRANIGASRVSGLESFVEVDVLDLFRTRDSSRFDIRWYNNLALTHSAYTESIIPNVKGSQVEYVPFLNWKTGLEWRYGQFKAGTQMSYLSRQFADATNAKEGGYSGVNGIIPAFVLFDISLGMNWKRYLLEASVNNVADAKYFTRRATGYPGPGIIPGEGRSFYLTLGVRL